MRKERRREATNQEAIQSAKETKVFRVCLYREQMVFPAAFFVTLVT
jgi:hypothetical protein